jgi:reverse gyrase
MPIAIREIADSYLTKPKYVSVTPISSTAETVEQKIYFVGKENKRKLLYHLIRNENLNNLLVFTRTKHGADNVVKALKKNGINAEAIHGDKSQTARQRVLESFKNKEISVLVATDIAARGIDIESLPYVLNFDLPKNEDVLKKLIKEADFYRLEGLKDIIYNQLNTVQQIQPVGNVHLFDSLILTPELSKDLSKLCKFTHNQK